MTISRDIDINFDDITPAELAEEFCDMGADNQALFFNYIAAEVGKWERSFCFQLQAITDSEFLTDGGRDIMDQIGDYSGKVQDHETD